MAMSTPRIVAPRTGWTFTCMRTDGSPEDCGFVVRDHDEAQLVRIVQMHARETHGFSYPEQQVVQDAVPVQW